MTDNRVVVRSITKEEFLEFVEGLEYNYRKQFWHLKNGKSTMKTASIIYMEFGFILEPYNESDILEYMRIKDLILKFAKKHKIRKMAFSYFTKGGEKVTINKS